MKADAVVKVADEIVATEVDEELVILNLRDGTYYGLNRTGRRVWELARKPRRVEEIVRHIAREFGVAEEQAREDVLELIEKLQAYGLVKVEEMPEN